jgi:hypothetical protein
MFTQVYRGLSRLHLRSHLLLGLAYKLQQSTWRGFQVGNNFKFPEVEGGLGGHEAAAGFSDDTGADSDRAQLHELFSFCHNFYYSLFTMYDVGCFENKY